MCAHIHAHAHRELEENKKCTTSWPWFRKKYGFYDHVALGFPGKNESLLKESKPTRTGNSSNYFKHRMVKSEKVPWKRELSIRCCTWERRPPWAATIECFHELPPWPQLLTVWIVWPLHIHPGTTTSIFFHKISYKLVHAWDGLFLCGLGREALLSLTSMWGVGSDWASMFSFLIYPFQPLSPKRPLTHVERQL